MTSFLFLFFFFAITTNSNWRVCCVLSFILYFELLWLKRWANVLCFFARTHYTHTYTHKRLMQIQSNKLIRSHVSIQVPWTSKKKLLWFRVEKSWKKKTTTQSCLQTVQQLKNKKKYIFFFENFKTYPMAVVTRIFTPV